MTINNEQILKIDWEIFKIKLQLKSNNGAYGSFKFITDIDINDYIKIYDKLNVLKNERDELMKIYYPEYCI